MRGAQGAESGGYDVQSTYFPAASTGYAPPPSAQEDPFAQADNGYAPSSSAEHQHVPEVVPAAVPVQTGAGDAVLHFQGVDAPPPRNPSLCKIKYSILTALLPNEARLRCLHSSGPRQGEKGMSHLLGSCG